MIRSVYKYRSVNELKIKCPNCDSEAIYKYGKTKNKKQRFKCIICGKQFSKDAKKHEIKGKPKCHICDNNMNLYRINGNLIIFRCSNYPNCKTYKKFLIKEVR